MSGAFYEADHFLILNSALGRGKHPRRDDGFQMQCPKIEYRHLSVLKQPTFSVPLKQGLFSVGPMHSATERQVRIVNGSRESMKNSKIFLFLLSPQSLPLNGDLPPCCPCSGSLIEPGQVWENILSIKSWSSERSYLSLSPNINHVLQETAIFLWKRARFLVMMAFGIYYAPNTHPPHLV